MPLSQADFDLFAPLPAAPDATPAHKVPGKAKPEKRGRPHALPRQPEAPMQVKRQKERKVMKQSLIAWGTSALVWLCLFACVEVEVDYQQALRVQQQLFVQLEEEKQRSIGAQAEVERKYSLDIVHEYALQQLHMVPIEGSRVTYITSSYGDRVLG
ncbi:MAG: hypothetical protein LBQ33_02680 [Oscillospiraceae bacterium]|nr:hypothetical protein [Oscillospiraceae bacterium]